MQRILAVVLLIVSFSTFARAQTLADRVPADAIAFLGWKGAYSPDNGYAGSHLQAIVDASGFAQIRDQVIPQLMQKITQQSNDHGKGALAAKTVLGIVWRHPTAAFFAGVSQDANGKTMPKLGLICQAGTDSDALMTIFNAGAHGPDAAPMSRTFTSGDCTVFLIGYEADDAIPSAGDSSKSLKASEDFIRMTAETGRDPLICGYVDVSRGFAQIDAAVAASPDDSVKDMWAKGRDASGLTDIKHISFGSGFDGKDWVENCFVEAPQPRSGLLAVLEPTAIDPALVARIPATASSAIVGQFNLGALLSQARAITVAVNPGAGDLFDKGMGVVQMMVGRSLQRDILDPLGSQWAIYSDASIPVSKITFVPPGSPNLPNMPPVTQGSNFVVVNKPADPDKAQQGWTMLSYAISNASLGFIQKNHWPISTAMTKNGDQSVFTIATPISQPSWTVKDGFMYFGSSPEGAIAAANAASGPPITEQPAFADLARQLHPAAPPITGFQFVNLPVSVPQGYAAQEAGMSQLRALAQQQSITLPENILPPLDKITPELEPALGVSWADASGWHSRSRAPFPGTIAQPETITAGCGGLMAGILLPSLNRARETANRVKCASDERQMGQAILLWANDHKGQYPPTMGDMLSEGIAADVFICPSGNNSLPAGYKTMAADDLAKWVNVHADYVYVGAGLTTSIGADQIVLYEKPGDHSAGMNILFGDGHVEFDLMPAAVKMIQDQNKTVPGVPLPGAPDAAPVTPAP